ncbi:nucleotidyltransferase family protein [candidate division CSSED10-310 bacterium]|uniref:Nucleotidyltransferase family protein n=1 Tax=candidate division CSSED10-310 bacterium TaxID=2855610 RepID=A0ABV6Z3K5_UNCC1
MTNLTPARETPLSPARVEALRVSAGCLNPLDVTQSWPTIIDWAIKDGFSGVLNWRLKQGGFEKLSPEVLAPLRQAVEIRQKQYILLQARWLQILEFLRTAGISVVSLKGLVLDRTVYPQAGLRDMDDFDILVPRESIRTTVAVLEKIGYVHPRWSDPAVQQYLMEHFHAIALLKAGQPIIDLHHALSPEVSSRAGIDVLNSALAGPEPGERVPAPPHLLFHVLHHGVRSGSGYRLLWPLDAWFIINKCSDPPTLLDQVVDLALRWQAPLFILQACRELRVFFGFDILRHEEKLTAQLRLPEAYLAKHWQKGIARNLSPALKIAHRLSLRPTVLKNSLFKSIIPPAGHTALVHNVDSRQTGFWRFRVLDMVAGFKKIIS